MTNQGILEITNDAALHAMLIYYAAKYQPAEVRKQPTKNDKVANFILLAKTSAKTSGLRQHYR